MFIGLRHFAGLLQLKTWLSKPLYVGVATVALTLMLWMTPHPPIKMDELTFNLLQSPNSADAILSLFCAMLVWVIRRWASLFYSRPLQWLAGALLFDCFGNVLFFADGQAVDANSQANIPLALVSAVFFLVSRILYLVAGYSLIRLTHKEEKVQPDASPIDVIVYMAGLVSKKADIDPMLDKLRVITVNVSTDRKLSSSQLHSLKNLYDQLRNYLLKREPLLALTTKSLDRRLQHKFGSIPFSDEQKNAG
jgi:hypothetical protein